MSFYVGLPDEYEEKEKKPKTNADRIRAMSDEELAEWLSEYTKCNICHFRDYCNGSDYNSCKEVFEEWLKKEVEE